MNTLYDIFLDQITHQHFNESLDAACQKAWDNYITAKRKWIDDAVNKIAPKIYDRVQKGHLTKEELLSLKRALDRYMIVIKEHPDRTEIWADIDLVSTFKFFIQGVSTYSTYEAPCEDRKG